MSERAFISLTDDGERFTCPMPASDSVVEVKLSDGSIQRAYYDSNIMEAGDWDFVEVDENDEPLDAGDSLADRVVAWRAA